MATEPIPIPIYVYDLLKYRAYTRPKKPVVKDLKVNAYICGGQSPRVGESFPLRWKIYAALQDPGSQLLPKWDYFESGQKHFF